MSDPVAGLPVLLGNIGLIAGVRDSNKVDHALRGLLALAEAEITSADGIVTVEIGLGEMSGAQTGQGRKSFSLYYGIRDGMLALGATTDWVETALSARPDGERLADGQDFRKVFKNLDAAPYSLTYFNLPRIRGMVEQSQFLTAMSLTND